MALVPQTSLIYKVNLKADRAHSFFSQLARDVNKATFITRMQRALNTLEGQQPLTSYNVRLTFSLGLVFG